MGSAAGRAGSAGGTSTVSVIPELTRWLGSRIVWPSTVTAPASISVFSRERDRSATWRASTRSSRSPASASAVKTDTSDEEGSVMSNLSGQPRGNLSGPGTGAESETTQLVARARLMMIVASLTTALAIAAVVAVIGYRIYAAGVPASEESVIVLPKGARVIATSG